MLVISGLLALMLTPVRSWPSRRALRAASISKVGLVIGHSFWSNDKEMTQNSEHYPLARIFHAKNSRIVYPYNLAAKQKVRNDPAVTIC